MLVFQSGAQKLFQEGQKKVMTLDRATFLENNIMGSKNMGVQGICYDMFKQMNRL